VNLLAYLANVPTSVEYFRRFNATRHAPPPGSVKKYQPFQSINPVKEVREIVKKERTTGRIMPSSEWHPLLLGWARDRYRDLDVDWRLQRGLSVAEAIQDEISAAISEGVVARTAKKKLSADPNAAPKDDSAIPRGNSSRTKKPVKQWWHGEFVQYPKKTPRFDLHVAETATQYARYRFPFTQIVDGEVYGDRSGKVKIYFGEKGIDMRKPSDDGLAGPIIWERSYANLARLNGGKELVAHARKEYEHNEEVEKSLGLSIR